MKTLLVLTGPTAVGKTRLALAIAKQLQSPVINADSRQIYKELPIGTAAPTAEEQAQVKHYFVGTKSVREEYNAGQYEADCLSLLGSLFRQHDTLLLTGGGMMYIDAVCNGLDEIPKTDFALRRTLQTKPLSWLQEELLRLDPNYYSQVDLKNPQRVMHAVEVSLTAGRPYSALRTRSRKQRDFKIIKTALARPREELYERINERVTQMIDGGLREEAMQVYPLRGLNSLNTVGYKEMFRFFDGEITLDEAIRLIRQNTRHYAKRQLTWFRQDKDLIWFNANTATADDILKLV